MRSRLREMLEREQAVIEAEKNVEKIKSVKVWRVILAFFVIGIAMGACSLGMKLPVALFELATGQPT